MVTIIKVKRKIDDDPVECLIIESKKKKIDSVDNESINYILKYAGTAKSENDIPYKINELNKQIRTKNDIQAEYKLPRAKRLKNVINKQTAIDDAKNDNKSQRYILLNKKRGLDEQNEDVNIIDVISSDYLDDLDKEKEKEDEIETSKKVRSGLSDHLRFVRNQLLFSNKDDDEISCNGVPLIKEKSNKNASEYIYDIYYAKNDSNSTYLDLLDSNNYNIKSYYGDENDYLINDEADDEFRNAYQDDEDEDSNDENNWKNDYPDEDGEHCDDYYNEYDYDYGEYGHKLSKLMKKTCAIADYDDDSENENSNDDDNEDDDYDEYNYEPRITYDKFKKKILKQLHHGDDDDDDNDN